MMESWASQIRLRLLLRPPLCSGSALLEKLQVFLGIRLSAECCLGAPVTREAVRSWLAGWFRQHGGSLPSPLACRVVWVTQRLPVFLSLRTTVLANPQRIFWLRLCFCLFVGDRVLYNQAALNALNSQGCP